MVFQHSAVTDIESWKSEETWREMPSDVHPVYLGSGIIAFGLDATGMQGLDARVMEQPEVVSMLHLPTHQHDDLVIHHAGTLSMHHRIEYERFAPGIEVPWNNDWTLLPAGYFDYALLIDGERYEPEDILRSAGEWTRSFSPLTGLCETSFVLEGVNFHWLTKIRPGSALAEFRLEMSAADDDPHSVGIEVRVHLTDRQGEAIASGGLTKIGRDSIQCVEWNATDETSTAPLKEPYRFCWGIGIEGPEKTRWTGHILSALLEVDLEVGMTTAVHMALFFGCSQAGTGSAAGAIDALAGFLETNPSEIFPSYDEDLDASEDEEDFEDDEDLDDEDLDDEDLGDEDLDDDEEFEDDEDPARRALSEIEAAISGIGATVGIGIPQIELLYHTQQYLLSTGLSWNRGLGANYLWHANFMGSTFWDSYFMVDGMLRTGHVDKVRQFIQWLAETAMQPEGRPFYWIHYYDGQPWADDVAYQVMAAHASCAIRYYEFTRDEDALSAWVYPIVSRVASYTRDNLIGLHDGLWRFKVIISGDVTGDDNPGTEETGVLAWLVVAMAKAVEYGRKLGEPEADLLRLEEVVESTRANPYDWSKPVMWWSWLPYITGAEPFYSAESWANGIREALAGEGIRHMMSNDSGQPWGSFSAATSMITNGLPDAGLRYVEEGIRQTYGVGYFCEFRYDKMENAGNAPFPTASGGYLSAISAFFANGTIWDDSIRIMDSLPSTWQSRRFDFHGICTPNGAKIQWGWYSPDRVTVIVDTDRPRDVTVGIPLRLWGVPLLVQANGRDPEVGVVRGDRTVSFRLEAGVAYIDIVEDTENDFEAAVFEPKHRGSRFVKLIKDAGMPCRLVRNSRALGDRLKHSKALLLPSSMIHFPAYMVKAVEQFVHDGGVVVGLHHAGCSEVNPRLAALFGVRARTEDRFKRTFTSRSFQKATEHPLTEGIPASFDIQTADALFTPDLVDDVTVLFRDSESGDAVATLRHVGNKGGAVLWLAPGQDSACRTRPVARNYQDIDTLGIRSDEVFTYPYLDSVPFVDLMIRCLKYRPEHRKAKSEKAKRK